MKRALIAALAAALAVTGCSGTDDKDTGSKDEGKTSSTATTPTAATAASTPLTSAASSPGSQAPSTADTSPPATSAAPPSATSTKTPPPAADGTVVTITITAGKVQTAARVAKIKVGSKVTLVVTSDVADEVHVHGYDIKKDVPVGSSVQIPFTADATGVFEVEFEKAALLLVKLQVQ